MFNFKRNLSSEFAIIICATMLLIVISMAAYLYYIMNNLNDISIFEKNSTTKSIANLITNSIQEDTENINLTETIKLTEKLCEYKLIVYAHIYDYKKKKFIWSTIPKFIGRKSIDNRLLPSITTISQRDMKDIEEQSATKDQYKITVGYYSAPLTYNYIQEMIDNYQLLAILFIFMGIFSAYIVSRTMSDILNNLADGASELHRGNLKFKIKNSAYKEIDILVNSFNEMASKLEHMYSYLENKVRERTKEIVAKSEKLEMANKEIKEAQTLLVHTEKMRSLGELVAGITHEINNPINFIYGNLIHLSSYSQNLLAIIDKYNELKKHLPEEDIKRIDKILEELEYNFISEDLPSLIKSCKDGAERTKNIVLDLKSFSRSEEMVINEIDVHKEIDTTLNILHNKYKNKITLHKEYGDVPNIEAYGGQLNQVFMNILDNASYAIKEQGDVYIRTRIEEDKLVIEFEDNGSGIKKENIQKIFEPFFTTKPVGQGTGLGMSISYKIIKKHNGNINIESEVGKGTKITITIPIKAEEN
jgi:signal transduction histidine kinase